MLTCSRIIVSLCDPSVVISPCSIDLEESLTELLAKISKYQVIEFLGSVGQADVFKAIYPHLKKEVDIQLGRCSSSSSTNDRLVNEGRLLTELDHTNICRVLDLDFHDGNPFIAMHYVAGKTLRQLTLDKINTHRLTGLRQVKRVASENRVGPPFPGRHFRSSMFKLFQKTKIRLVHSLNSVAALVNLGKRRCVSV